MGWIGGSTTVQAPAPRDVAGEYRDTLKTQLEAMTGTGEFAEVGSIPDIEASTRPAMEQLDLASYERMLNGIGDQRGMLDLLSDDIQPRMNELEGQALAARAGNEQDILAQYGGQVADNLRDAAGNRDILESLRTDAEEDLAAGYALNPAQRREFEQNVRSGQAARGLGYGDGDALHEAMTLTSAGEARRRERQGFAQGVAGQLQASGGDPMLALLGRPSQTLGLGQQFGAQANANAANIGTRVVNPESAYANNIYAGNNQAALAASTATAANNAEITGAAIGAIGGMISPMKLCWVAREVYGDHNPRWLQFREWMIHRAPKWFLSLYMSHGERVARWIRPWPKVKNVIRRWMDARIDQEQSHE